MARREGRYCGVLVSRLGLRTWHVSACALVPLPVTVPASLGKEKTGSRRSPPCSRQAPATGTRVFYAVDFGSDCSTFLISHLPL